MGVGGADHHAAALSSTSGPAIVLGLDNRALKLGEGVCDQGVWGHVGKKIIWGIGGNKAERGEANTCLLTAVVSRPLHAGRNPSPISKFSAVLLCDRLAQGVRAGMNSIFFIRP